MLGQWLDTSEAVAFARELALDITRAFPPTQNDRKPTSPKKGHRKLDNLVRRTCAFAQGHKLNVYKRGKLLNTIKWELRDAGHPESFVDEVIALLAPLLG